MYNAVISDLSHMLCIPKPTENPILISYIGITNIYSPPEIIKKEKFNGFIVDMWYIGVIFYIMLKGNKAWDNIIINNEYDLKLHQTMIIWKISNNISINSRIALQSLLEYEPEKRGNIKYIMSRIKMAQNILK
jgi:serine/threonine protein kinase